MMTLNEFKRFSSEKGFYWFAPSSIRFFRSRISNWDCISGYFISSEQGPVWTSGRGWTIRKADFETGSVETIGEFQQYGSLRTAKTALRRLQRGKMVNA